MAENTKVALRNQVIYSIYVRNHTAEGTFRALEPDLDRIKELRTDIIWFMPIHPIGKKARKGSLGCPYAIEDYRKTNPEYGTKEDFIHLVDEIHKRGMKCMIDVVYNHTSPDSWLWENKPEYFYRKPDGRPGTKTGEWSDIIDLDYNVRELWDYQIDTLCMWAEIVDGFRCDVAPLIPLEFWKEARQRVSEVKEDVVWLSESVEVVFIRDNRRRGLTALSDGEVFQAFDVCYDYDVYYFFLEYLEGKMSLKRYIQMLNFQHGMYPDNYVKLRFLENHDRDRAKKLIPNDNDLKNWTAFMYFQKGMTLLYAGQETENTVRPDLFDIDKVDWNTGKDISGYLRTLYDIKQDAVFADGDYFLEADECHEIVTGYLENAEKKMVGIFCLKSEAANVRVPVPDGTYKNKIDGKEICVKDELLHTDGTPMIFEVK